jgi:hypothetical protein
MLYWFGLFHSSSDHERVFASIASVFWKWAIGWSISLLHEDHALPMSVSGFKSVTFFLTMQSLPFHISQELKLEWTEFVLADRCGLFEGFAQIVEVFDQSFRIRQHRESNRNKSEIKNISANQRVVSQSQRFFPPLRNKAARIAKPLSLSRAW